MQPCSILIAITFTCLTVTAADLPDVSAGEHLFRIYCIGCHGVAARGDGPAVGELKTRPTDLTRLSRDNDGEFPRHRLLRRLSGIESGPGHGAGEMPLWGLTLRQTGSDTDQQEETESKIRQLVDYLESVQNLK